jgi:hypothetical protein
MTLAPALADTAHVNTSGAARLLGCTRQRTLSLAARGLLQPITMAGRVFFERAKVEALRDRLAAEREPAPASRRRRARR